MADFELRSRIDAPAAAVFNWHANPGAFERLRPPWMRIRVLERSGWIANGSRVVLELGTGLLRRRWHVLFDGYEPGRQFCDEQVRGPFAYWRHTHRFVPIDDAASELVDRVEYRLPLAALGDSLAGAAIYRQLERAFAWRHRRTQFDVVRQRQFAEHRPQRVVVSGASGLVGGALVAFLTAGGHTVQPLVRRRPHPGSDEIGWDPLAGEIEAQRLEGCDAVVHLAGASVAAGRWSAERKGVIRDSRVRSTHVLSEALAKLRSPPRAFICASAVGYYGSRGDEPLDEQAAAGTGFLAETCTAWEGACAAARAAGIRVVNLRVGTVLARDGGALRAMLPAFSWGLGGPVGSGRQYLSWIALDDLVGAIHFLLFREDVRGPVNATAPHPVTNRAFARTLGRVLHRPAITPLPAAVVRTLFGEMGTALLLSGARVLPAALQSAGFRFLCEDLESALRWELGRLPRRPPPPLGPAPPA